jgi:hypothetical protein
MMSFPDSYIFDLSKMRAADVVRLIGNAVPPNFSYNLSLPVRDIIVDKIEADQRKQSYAGKIEGLHVPVEKNDTSVHNHHAESNENEAPTGIKALPVQIDAANGHGSKDDPIALD